MTKRLFVGNLAYQTTEASLQGAFEQQGHRVRNVRVMTDRDTGRSRGFAFVEMESDEEAQAAIGSLDGFLLDGRNLRVNEAEERAPRPAGGPRPGGPSRSSAGPRSGGGGGSGGGSGGGGGYRGNAKRGSDRGYDRGGERGFDRGGERGGGRKSSGERRSRGQQDFDEDDDW